VRTWGGVLEHPAETRAFKFHGIPEPVSGSWQLTIDGDWVTEIWQSAYGHRARKRTWLVYGGSPPAPLNWERKPGQFQIGYFDQKRPQLPKAERSRTPLAFRDLLLSIARSATAKQEAA
jgi:hypothetical protein